MLKPKGAFVQTSRLMTITPYPDVNMIAHSILSQLQELLGETLVGLYLGGSLVTGDFDTQVSDIDLIAALAADVNESEFVALRDMHTALAQQYKEWDDRIEVCYVPADALRHIKTDTRLIVNISPGEPFHRTRLRQAWIVNWYMVREKGITLYGPNPKAIIEPISREEFVECVRDHAKSWNEWVQHMRRRKQQAYAVLSMCRAFYGAQCSDQVSKKQAALWAAHELPEWSELIHNALQWREAPDDDIVDHEATFPETQMFIGFVRNKIVQ